MIATTNPAVNEIERAKQLDSQELIAGGKSVWPMALMQRNSCLRHAPCVVGQVLSALRFSRAANVAYSRALPPKRNTPHLPAAIWESADIPEYDLDRDELVYRNRAGSELLRERFERDAREEAETYSEVA